MEMKRKPVVFNMQDPFQVKLLEHAEKQTNYSAYIKRLIQRDMEAPEYSSPTNPETLPYPASSSNEPETVWISVTAKGARFSPSLPKR